MNGEWYHTYTIRPSLDCRRRRRDNLTVGAVSLTTGVGLSLTLAIDDNG